MKISYVIGSLGLVSETFVTDLIHGLSCREDPLTILCNEQPSDPPSTNDAEVARDRAIPPGLTLVATPIGNLRDITLRALDVLAAADLVLAEDTRVAGKLLQAYGLSAKLERYDEHGAERTRPRAMAALAEGKTVALVSDAGTPRTKLASRAGWLLVSTAASASTASPAAASVTRMRVCSRRACSRSHLWLATPRIATNPNRLSFASRTRP